MMSRNRLPFGSHFVSPLRTRTSCMVHPMRRIQRAAFASQSTQDVTGGPVAFDVQGLTTEASATQKKISEGPPAFGTEFTDHMLSVRWSSDNGWDAPRIHPLEDLRLHPAASSLHYAFQCFEGTKAYRDRHGKVRLFRPDMNFRRMNESAARLMLPQFDERSAIQLLARFVGTEDRFVPQYACSHINITEAVAYWILSKRGHSLYLRPTLISTEPAIAMAPPRSALFYILACPVGNFYETGTKAISLEANTQYTRAWPGGVGDKKVGANYAACFLPQVQAAQRGFQQNLWMIGEEEYLSEVGTMNLFVIIQNRITGKDEIITPPLDGTVLPGVTRDSVLQLAQTRLPPDRYTVSERGVTMPEVAQAASEGRLREVFGAGTAVVIAPVRTIGWRGQTISCGLKEGEESGKIATLMRDWIDGIQYGDIEHEWSWVIE